MVNGTDDSYCLIECGNANFGTETKGEVFHLQAMKSYRGSRGMAPHILNLGTRWRWIANFTPRLFYSRRKEPRCFLNRRLGGPRNGLDIFEKRKKSFAYRGILNPDRPTRSLCPTLYVLPQHWYLSARLLCLTPHKAVTLVVIAVRTPDLKYLHGIQCVQ
jgi:hypothetical protein